MGDDNIKLNLNYVGFDFYVIGWKFLKHERKKIVFHLDSYLARTDVKIVCN
jgi:hypothetical protein